MDKTGFPIPIFKKVYFIMLEDVEETFNLNAHSYECSAYSKEEAVGMMVLNRPDLYGMGITSIEEIK